LKIIHLVVYFQLNFIYNFAMFTRHITPTILEALQDTPIVFLRGARQVGKSFLAQHMAYTDYPARYLTLDDITVREAARTDPSGFLQGLGDKVVLDEVQRAPDLFLALKAEVDRNRRPGRFLLTGSADVMLLPDLAKALVGRMEVFTLWPFSQGKIESKPEGFIKTLFGSTPLQPTTTPLDRSQLHEMLLRGGYPTAYQRQPARRRSWFSSYLDTLLQREVRELANIEGLTALLRLLKLLATRTASTINFADFSRSSAIPQTTLKRYLALLETTFLIRLLPAWSGNLGKRLVKAPKLILNDTGLTAYLLGLGPTLTDQNQWGPLIENFVAMELMKQSTWTQHPVELFHFRTHSGREVDLVLEDPTGRLVGIEVKASATVKADDFKGLHYFAEEVKTRFHRGIVLYTGNETVPFGPDLYALPITSLWTL
jgi:predicted AAA+ superfamily ATPase